MTFSVIYSAGACSATDNAINFTMFCQVILSPHRRALAAYKSRFFSPALHRQMLFQRNKRWNTKSLLNKSKKIMSHQGCNQQQQREKSSTPGRCHHLEQEAGPSGRCHGPRHSDRREHHCDNRESSPEHRHNCERRGGPPAWGPFMHHGHHRGMGRHHHFGMRGGFGRPGFSFHPFGRPENFRHGPCHHNNDNEHPGGATPHFHRGPHFGKHFGHRHFGKHHEGGCRYAQRRHSIDVAAIGNEHRRHHNHCC